MFKYIGLFFLLLIFTSPNMAHAYADTDDTDIIMDAPWRTVRDYLPFLVFTPDVIDGEVIKSIELYNYNLKTGKKILLFKDQPKGSDTIFCSGEQKIYKSKIIDPEGRFRSTIKQNEKISNFWHYIVRIPTKCIGIKNNRGAIGDHYLLAIVKWKEKHVHGLIKKNYQTSRVLRVLIEKNNFPKFDKDDHYYDAHVHTIAEQTKWHGKLNVNASRKAFGGPLAMLTESAYALGLIDTQLKNGNWSDFRDQLATTDHNVFFSGNPYDAGSAPGYGPTKNTNGKEKEFRWYRKHFGELGGEEITLPGTGLSGKRITDNLASRGSHFLSYGAPHFHGPWHGGKFTATWTDTRGIPNPFKLVGVDNPVTITKVLQGMHNTNGFGYAAHPMNEDDGWPMDYYQKVLGYGYFNNDGGESSIILQKGGNDFIFKGLQIWNEKNDFTLATKSINYLDSLNPFPIGDSDTKFSFDNGWDNSLKQGLNKYFGLIHNGLRYSFRQQPNDRFIHKLYISAGTDAHGDFNHKISLQSTAEAEIYDFFDPVRKLISPIHNMGPIEADTATVSSNAFGRLRTYTLTGEKFGRYPENLSLLEKVFHQAPTNNNEVYIETPGFAVHGLSEYKKKVLRTSVKSYREGNTVLTDGPICRFNIDSNCRFDSKKLKWHDKSCRWENADGFIGGSGNFDGGGTALINQDSIVVLNTQWDGKNDYYPDSNQQSDKMVFNYTVLGYRKNKFKIKAGKRKVQQYSQLPNSLYNSLTYTNFKLIPSAFVLEGLLGSEKNRSLCITNPIWSIPTKIYMSGLPKKCPIKPGQLSFSVKFGVSMSTEGASIMLYPLDSNGKSIKKGTPLIGQWYETNLGSRGEVKINNAVFGTSNKDRIISCPEGNWDAELHKKIEGKKSFVIVVSGLKDMHGNKLNSIAKTFTLDEGEPLVYPTTPPENTEPKPCKAKNKEACTYENATCEAMKNKSGERIDMCRWADIHDAFECAGYAWEGIWVSLNSTFAKDYPGAIIPGLTGACLAVAKDMKWREH